MLSGMRLDVLFRESSAMWFLLAASVVGLTFAVERLWYYFKWQRSKRRIDNWLKSVREKIQKGAVSDVLEECKREKHPVARIVEAALENKELSSEDMSTILNSRISRVQIELEENLSILGTLSSIAPLLGLFGTITGIIRSFRDIAITGSGGSTVVAMGVAVALVTTAVGIIIAVPMLVAYNYFVRKVTVETAWLEQIRDEIIVWMNSTRRKLV